MEGFTRTSHSENRDATASIFLMLERVCVAAECKKQGQAAFKSRSWRAVNAGTRAIGDSVAVGQETLPVIEGVERNAMQKSVWHDDQRRTDLGFDRLDQLPIHRFQVFASRCFQLATDSYERNGSQGGSDFKKTARSFRSIARCSHSKARSLSPRPMYIQARVAVEPNVRLATIFSISW
jgi:hypothetical protein